MTTAPDRAGERSRPDALDDPDRIRAVRRLLATGSRSAGLDRLTRLAARLLDVESAQVSLTADDEVVASTAGPAAGAGPRRVPRQESLCTVTALQRGPLVVGDARRDQRVLSLRPVTSGEVGSYLGVQLVDEAGRVLGALCAHDPEPRTWTPQDVGTLGELAGSVVAELELAAVTRELASGAARLDLALAGADVGSFDWDLDSDHVLFDERLRALFGHGQRPGGVPDGADAFLATVHPADVGRVAAALRLAVTTRGELVEEYRVRRADGVRWVQLRGRVVGFGPGPRRLVGVAYDVTQERHRSERLHRVLESITDAFLTADEDWRLTYVNSQAQLLLGRAEAALVGTDLWQALAPELALALRPRLESAVADGGPDVFERRVGASWLEVRVWPGPDGVSVHLHDATSRHGAQEEREQAVLERERAYASAEAAGSRLELLADASTRLSASLEPRQVLDTLARLVLPGLGSFLVVSLARETAAPLLGLAGLPDDVRVDVVHLAHARSELEPALRRLAEQVSLSSADRLGPGAVIRTGSAEWLPDVGAELRRCPGVTGSAADWDLLAAGAALTVPLVSRGRRLGALTVGDPLPAVVDRALLTDLASRAAVALDNALLYGAERRTGLELQRSLLPRDVPEPPGVRVAVRYLPGATGAFVGGDWYQGVLVGGGLLLAMGDVMGHGMRSAARMGQLRAIVATLALEGHRPGALLERLARSTHVLLDLELATLLVAFYDPAARTLAVASAGHPPPVLAPLDGEPGFVELDPGPPLGTFTGEHTEVVVDVPEGATLVLYTDGLVENRAESLEHGLERLRRSLTGLRRPPEAVADHVLEVLGRAQGGNDDVALLVLAHGPAPAQP